MTDEKPRHSSTSLENLAEIYRLLGRNEARIAGLTRHLEELLRLLETGKEKRGSAKDSQSDGSP